MGSTFSVDSLEFQPLTPERWPDFEQLFGEHRASGGCWCMWWRISRQEFERNHNAGNRQAMYELVHSGEIPGILAYHANDAIGWCSVAPRESFAALNRSPVLRSVDDQPVWSIVCFFIAPAYRGQGVMAALIQAACQYAHEQGGRLIEAYPTIPQDQKHSEGAAFMGIPAVFEQAGFVTCKRASARKIILRKTLG